MQVAVTTPTGLDLKELPERALETEEVRLQVIYCGICGSDVNHFSHLPTGTVMGHEMTGRVIEVGPGVTGWSIGDRASTYPFEACGTCKECKRGLPHLCGQFSFYLGLTNPGGYAERVITRASMLVRLPDSLDDLTATLVEPLSVGLHAITMSGVDSDQPVLVMGAGPVGFLTVLALRARGYKNQVVFEPREDRRANLEKAGIRTLPEADADRIREALGGTGPLAVFECAGYPGALAKAIELIEPRGKIVATSVPPMPVSFEQWNLIAKEASIVSGVWYTRAEFEEAVNLLDSGKVPSEALPMSTAALSEAPQAMVELIERRSPYLKVMLHPVK